MVGEFVASSVLGGMFYEAVKGGSKKSRAFLENKGFLENDVTAILEEIDEQKPFHSQEAFEAYVSNSKLIQEAINNISTTQNNDIETNNGAVVQNNSGNITIDNSKTDKSTTINNYINEKKNDKYLTPLVKEEKFLHREKELKDIQTLLENNEPLLLVNGIGGIGKTALAKEYLKKHRTSYKHIAYVECKKGLESALLDAFERKVEEGETQEQALKKLFKDLSNYEPLNLLVLDDIQNEEEFKNLPHLPNFHTLLTSRSTFKEIENYKVSVMNKEDITDIFFTFYTKEVKQDITKLLKHLDSHTAFVKLTAQTMEASNILDIKTMISKFEKGELTTVRTNEDKTFNTYLQELFTLQNLEQPLITLLQQLSFLPTIELSFKEIELYLNKEETREELDINLQKLYKQGWLQQTENGTYKLHQIIQTFLETNHRLSFKEIEPFIKHYINLLKTQPHESGIIKEEHLPFAKALLQYTKEEKRESIATLLNNLSTISYSLGRLEESLTYQQKVIEIYERVLDKKNPYLATSYNNLSMILQDLGRLEEALAYQEKTLEIRESVLDKKHPDLAMSYNNLSGILQALRKLEEALTYQKKALEIQESVLDKKHPDLARSYNNLSMILQDLGRLEEALAYQKKTLEIKESVLDKKHPSLATSYHNFSSILQALGRLEEALDYQKKALEIDESVLDKKHPSLMISYWVIAAIYFQQEMFQEAHTYINKAVSIYHNVFPEGHSSYKGILEWQKGIKKALLVKT